MGHGWKKVLMIGALCISFAGGNFSVRAEEYEYDALNRVTKVIYEDGSCVLYEYDSNGNLLRIMVEEADKEKDNTKDQPQQNDQIHKEIEDNSVQETEAGKEVEVAEAAEAEMRTQADETPNADGVTDTEESSLALQKISKLICIFLLIVIKICRWLQVF